MRPKGRRPFWGLAHFLKSGGFFLPACSAVLTVQNNRAETSLFRDFSKMALSVDVSQYVPALLQMSKHNNKFVLCILKATFQFYAACITDL